MAKKCKYKRYAQQYQGIKLDPYRVLHLYRIEHPAQQHAIKKLMRAGKGAKSLEGDIKETIDSLKRWLEMIKEDTK